MASIKSTGVGYVVLDLHQIVWIIYHWKTAPWPISQEIGPRLALTDELEKPYVRRE